MANTLEDSESFELLFEDLSTSFPNLPSEAGVLLAQAAVVCLNSLGHLSGTRLSVTGDFRENLSLCWSMPITDAMLRYWNDMEEATEQGAYAVAILIVRALTGFSIVERSRKGTGFDWWLGNEDNLFQAKACLEVSGILQGSTKRINDRLKARMRQLERSDYLDLPGYVAIIEFGRPQAKVMRYEGSEGASS